MTEVALPRVGFINERPSTSSASHPLVGKVVMDHDSLVPLVKKVVRDHDPPGIVVISDARAIRTVASTTCDANSAVSVRA